MGLDKFLLYYSYCRVRPDYVHPARWIGMVTHYNKYYGYTE